MSSIQPIAVLGPYRGGTSLVTGMLQKLGCFAGERFFQAYTGYCTYEAEFLRNCSMRCFDENAWVYKGTFDQRVGILREWAEWASATAVEKNCPAFVGKHPALCMLVEELSIAWSLPNGTAPAFVCVDRPLESVIKSWETALTPSGHRWWPRQDKREVVTSLIETRNKTVECKRDVNRIVHVDFDRLRSHPIETVTQLASDCGLAATNINAIVQEIRTPAESGNAKVNASQVQADKDRYVANRLADHQQRLRAEIHNMVTMRRGPLPSTSDILLVAVVFNEEIRIPDTLRHYRQLGVNRFAVIDNQSTDGTRDFLLGQQDVDLYSMPMDYKTSVGGCGWVSALIHEFYGTGRWVLWSDADEQLVYDGCEQHDLKQLIGHLSARNITSLPAVMVDMYSDTSIASTVLTDSQPMLERCSYFDGAGYQRTEINAVDQIPRVIWSGGPEERVFGNEPGWIAKVPLISWQEDTWYWNPHVAYPFELNFSKPIGAMLHFKFLSDFYSVVGREVQRNQHAQDAAKYRKFQQRFLALGDISLMNDHSVHYQDSQSLLDKNLITSVDWDS